MKRLTKADLQRFYDSDRAILISCIFIALVFWLLVKMSQPFPTSIEYDIDYKLPNGKSFITSPPEIVSATVSGSGWDLISSSFRNRAASIQFELSEMASQGIERNSVIERIKKTLPDDIQIQDINTDYIFIQMEDETEKKVPVRLINNTRLAPQFQLSDSIILIPDSIILTGPATEVAEIEFWETTPLDLEGIKKSQEIRLALKSPQNKELHLSEEKIIVQVPVEQFTEKSVFVPIQVRNGPDTIKVFPEMIKLSCIVGLSKFNQVNKSSFTLVADLKGIPLNAKNNTVPVALIEQPSFVRAINYQPKSVEFFFVETRRDSTAEVKKQN
jgi:YbbR domain-containing protein